MMFRTILVSLLIQLVTGQQHDLTRTNGAVGPEVVNAVISVIQRTCIFNDPLLYLRRVAYVDTHDGTDPSTFASPFQGGIWQISEAEFNLTRTSPFLQPYRDLISQNLFIQWNTAFYQDLRKPIYSALATQLSAILESPDRVIPISVEDQAALWSRGTLSANDFVKAAETLQMDSSFQQDVDIVFVLDSSASMSTSDFERAKLFLINVIRGLDIDSGKVQVALVEFSTIVYPQFGLNNGMTSSEMQQVVRDVAYQPGSTATAKALEYVRDNVLQESEGARSGAAQLIVLITDGISSDTVATVEAARDLRAGGVTISAVAVGDSIDQQELESVVNSPACSYIQTVSTFTDLPTLGYSTVQLAKQNPVVLKPGTYTFSCNTDVLVESVSRETNGLTIEVKTSDGQARVYGTASSAIVPGPALYTFTGNVSYATPLQIHVRDGTGITLAVRNMETGGCKSNVQISVKLGNHLKSGADIRCIENGLVSGCDAKDYVESPFILTATPPEEIPQTLCKSSSTFLTKYPGKTDRYLVCNRGYMIVVFCGITQTFDLSLGRCVQSGVTQSPFSTRSTTPIPYVGTTPPLPHSVPVTNPCTAENIRKGKFYFQVPGDEQKYIHCGIYIGFGIVVDCGNHHYFSTEILTCLNRDPVDVSSGAYVEDVVNPCIMTDLSGTAQFYAYPGDPHKFIQCDQYGDAYIQECNSGLLWSEASLACVHDVSLIG